MNVGGPAVEISALMRNMDDQRFEQHLVTGWCAEDEADFLQTQAPDVPAVRIHGLGRAIRPWDDVGAMQALRGYINTVSPDIVHTHTAKAGVIGRLAARSVRSKPALVHTFHGHLLHGYFPPYKTAMITRMERLLATRTDRFIAVGRQVRDDLLAAGIGTADRYSVVPPGVQLGPLPDRSIARQQLGLDQGSFVVGFIGRVTAIKRPDRMLEVARGLVGSGTMILVAGSGDLDVEIRQTAMREQLPVRFLGWRDDVESVLAACDAVLLTSDNEGMPLSLIQAGFAGLPVVATNVGSVSDIVVNGETGFLTHPDARQLQESLERLRLQPELAEKLGSAARKRNEELFSIDSLVRSHDAIYRSVRKQGK